MKTYKNLFAIPPGKMRYLKRKCVINVRVETRNLGKSENFGQFIFPKSVLVAKGIISQNEKGGKRGIRVYAPWDKPINKQAIQTKAWQVLYFVEIKENTLTDLEKINRILSN